MKIKFFCPRWGSESLSWKDFMIKASKAGYQGVECGFHHEELDRRELDEIFRLANDLGLLVIAQHWSIVEADVQKHKAQLHQWILSMKEYDFYKISSQTGRDFFSREENLEIIRMANMHGVIHETHRSKALFAAHIAKELLEEEQQIRLTLDMSHWVCVAESYLEDQHDALNLAVARTDHIHARVGYPEGPQISDPRLSTWKEAFDYHLKIWDAIVARKKANNEELSITSEFGPYPYMVHLPNSNEPIANQWEINKFMMDYLSTRYL